jgi:hypothetical protein
MDRELLSGFLVGVKLVSHLVFVDNTLIFCDADRDPFLHLCCLFLCFEVVSGLKINLSKLELVPVGIVNDIGGLARTLGCRVPFFPMKYLGLPLRALYKAKLIWDGILQKMERHLTSWKRLYLLKGW